jgi:adenylosuccinate lyase
MHELIREQAMTAWETVRSGEANPLAKNLSEDAEILKFLSVEQVHELMDYKSHLGDAPVRARELAKTVEKEISNE